MADIELIVKISENRYRRIREDWHHESDAWDSYEAIRNGIPLPKGHGKIGDIDKLYQVFERNVAGAKAFKDLFDNADTIIEADKGNEE